MKIFATFLENYATLGSKIQKKCCKIMIYGSIKNKEVTKKTVLRTILKWLNILANYSGEIKDDNDLIVAFEGILLSLIELKDEKSAGLLDEFIIH